MNATTDVSSITLGTAVGQWSMSAKAGQTSGNGGTISVQTDGQIILGDQGTSVDVSVPSSGNGGQISLTAQSLSSQLASTLLSADGGTSSVNGGTINVSTGEGLMIGDGDNSVELSAVGGASGDGGTISLTADTNDGDDSGGTPALRPSSRSPRAAMTTGLTIDGAHINVTPGQNGSGGTLTGSGKAALFSNTINLNASTSGTNPNGKGGNLTVNADTISGTAQARITSNGIGTGAGGTITLQTATGNAYDLSGNFISATGGEKGAGGNVLISSANVFKTNTVLYPAAYINVNPGSQADPSLSAGSMQLNGVLCQQIPTNLALSHVWLSYYWNCSNPSGPSGVDSNVPFSANLLDIGLRDKFAANSPLPVQLYVVNNITDVNNFFANTRPPLVPLPEGTFGITYYSNNGYGQSAILEMFNGKARNPGVIITPTKHELGPRG